MKANVKLTNQININNDSKSFLSDQSKDAYIKEKTKQTKEKRQQKKEKNNSKVNISHHSTEK